jgi:hypothetical protein
MVAVTAACQSSRPPTRLADFIAQFPEARKQPSDAAFQIGDVTLESITKPFHHRAATDTLDLPCHRS